MMVIERNTKFYTARIRQCKKNIEFIARSNFTEREKIQLKESYLVQQRNYETKLASFLAEDKK
jgi:hypothetical protein